MVRASAIWTSISVTLLTSVGCADQSAQHRTADVGPWIVTDPPPRAGDHTRILIVHDMEGLSGQDDWRTFTFGQPEYATGQELLAGDINAVAAGLFAGGAAEVHLLDGHGSGNPAPDARPDLLDPRIHQVNADRPVNPYMEVLNPGAYSGIVLVGQHPKTGSGGFAAHTWASGFEIALGDLRLTETEMLALTWGAAGVPVIMVSGDDRLERELRDLPWIEYVTVKRSITARTVELRDVDEVHADLEEAAARAVQRLGRAAVVRITLPAEVTVRAGPPSSLALLDGVPGVAYSDGGVTFRAGRLDEVWAGVNALVRLAVIEFTTIRSEVLSNHPAGPEIQQRFVEALGSRALEVAEGRYVQSTDGERPSPFSFFGVQ